MSIRKGMLALVVVVSVCFSAEINISGKVTDATGLTPIPGAIVKLEQEGLTATSGADGSFSLTSTVGINSGINQLQPHKVLASISNGVIHLQLQEKCQVEIITHTLHGKAVSRVKKVMDMGSHRIAQPFKGTAVYVYRIKSGSNELVLKSPSIGRVSDGTGLRSPGIASAAIMSRASSYDPIHDVIAVTKDGYLDYRVIVTNSDTSGIEIKLIVCAGTVTDIDGNVYQTVKIGDQEWTVENLRTTKYNDGTPITFDTSTVTWNMAETEKYCYYTNTTNTDSIKKYGALYNWYVVSPANPKKIAPAGWHVPTDAEWTILEKYLVLNGFNWDGTTDTSSSEDNRLAKSIAAKTGWNTSDLTGATGNDLTNNNRSGFTALPGGYRFSLGKFFHQGNMAYWWSGTENDEDHAHFRYLNYDWESLFSGINRKPCGYSLRLLKD